MATAPTKKSTARKAPAKKAAAKKSAVKKAATKKVAKKTSATKSAVKKATRQVAAQKRATSASFSRLADDASGFASQVGTTAQSMAKSASAKAGSAFNSARQYVQDHPAQAAAIASASIAAVGALATRKKWPAIARTAALAAPLAAGSRMLADLSTRIK